MCVLYFPFISIKIIVMKRLVISLLALVVLSATTCKKFNCAESVYSFEAKAKILNAADSIIIDTIWLEIISPVIQRNFGTGETVNYSDATNLGTAIGFGELALSSIKGAANDFIYLLEKGTVINNTNVNEIREYRFSEHASNYEFRLGVIPKRKGVFSIGLSNAVNVYRSNDKCTKANYTIYYTNTDQHLYFIKEIVGTEPDAGAKATYCFKVK